MERTLVLASTSPYRQELLKRLGLPFETASPDIDESRKEEEEPEELVMRLSLEKAKAAVAALHEISPETPADAMENKDAAAAGLGGPWYLGGAFVLGVALTLFALRLVTARNLAAARGLFLASVLYLPALCSLLLAARFQDVTR